MADVDVRVTEKDPVAITLSHVPKASEKRDPSHVPSGLSLPAKVFDEVTLCPTARFKKTIL